MTALALSYRPKKMQDVIGQNRTTVVIKAMVKQNDLPPCLIFGGTRGSGKTTLARILAAALNCSKQEGGEPCTECPSCTAVAAGNSTSVLEIDAASNGGVDEIRKIKDLSLYAHEGEWRVVLLDEAHALSTNAWNALLKLLEEPPPRTVFVLLTTEVYKIPDTIQSRSFKFEFRRITQTDIVGRLKYIADTEKIEYEEDLLSEIARFAKGGMRDAVMTLDHARRLNTVTGEQFREQFGVAEAAPAIIRAALASDRNKAVRLAGEAIVRTGDGAALVQELQETLVHLITCKAGGVPDCLPQSVPERQLLAQACDAGALAPALRVLWSASERIRTADDQMTSVQVAVALMSDALVPIPRAISAAGTPITTTEESQPMSLAAMQALAGQTFGS